MEKAQKKEEMQKKKHMERLIKIFPNRFLIDSLGFPGIPRDPCWTKL